MDRIFIGIGIAVVAFCVLILGFRMGYDAGGEDTCLKLQYQTPKGWITCDVQHK